MSYKTSLKQITILILRAGIGVMFVVAGVTKLADIKTFTLTLQDFGFSWDIIRTVLAYMVPIVELISGTCMIVGFALRYSSAMTLLLLLTFIALIIPIITVGQTVNCGCFGSVGNSPVDVTLLVRDVVLFGMTLLVFNYRCHILSIDNILFSEKD